MAKRYGEPYIAKVDKNGTKHWVDPNCPKCGGSGHIFGYEYVQGGVCFKCGGSGAGSHGWKEYTPEYAEKLAAQRDARACKKNLEKRADWLFEQGFNEYDTIFVVVGNTYDIREELKERGAKYSGVLGWHFMDKPADLITVELSVGECFWENDIAAYHWREMEEIEAIIKERTPKEAADPSQYVGTVGERLTVEVSLVKSFSYEGDYGFYPRTMYIHNFVDDAGNVFIWKTSTHVSSEDGKIKLTGKVKEHSEYREVKQTVLTRCKIA